jgi:hypothetical protein
VEVQSLQFLQMSRKGAAGSGGWEKQCAFAGQEPKDQNMQCSCEDVRAMSFLRHCSDHGTPARRTYLPLLRFRGRRSTGGVER